MKRTVLLLLFLGSIGLHTVFSQTKTITGIVTSSEDGLSIPGVSIVVEGTTIGTITGFEGEFTLQVPETAKTIVFSFVGMKTQQVAITGVPLEVVMAPDAIGVDEVVVTAMGIKRDKKALGYSTQEVDNEEITKTGNADLSGAMQGKVSGVDIKPSSGMPGASSQITIRGSRSFTGNNTPLYVVDGMPISSTADFSTGNSVSGADIANRAVDIDPNDIASINILKGQAAAALYGIRASNGVVVITTKSGKGIGLGKPVITFNHNSSFSTVSRNPDYQSTYAQGSGGNYLPTSSLSWGPKIVDLPDDPTYGGNNHGEPGKFYVPQLDDAGLDPYVTPGVYNPWKDYFSTGYSTTNGINVSQATEKGNFSVGLSYTTQDGIAPGTGMDRWNAKGNASQSLGDNFKIGFSANYANIEIDKLSSGNDASLAGVYSAPPSYNLKGYPSSLPLDPYTQIYYRSSTFDNPYWVQDNNVFNEQTDRFFGNMFGEYTKQLLDELRMDVRYQLGIDTYSSHYQDIFGFGSKGKQGEISNYGVTSTTYNSLLTANFDWKINEEFRFNGTIGNELNHTDKKKYDDYGQNFNFGGWSHIQNTEVNVANEEQESDRTFGLFFNLALSYQSMLFLNITGRSDVVSSMPRNNRSFFYPSFSLGWVATELDALQQFDWLSYAKLRASYAEVGQAGDYLTNFYEKPEYGGGFYSSTPIIYPIDGVNSFTPSTTIYDPDLKPQNTQSYELGVEVKFLKNRLGFDYTYSRQNVEDQIFAVPLTGSSGAEEYITNGGKVHTNAHELILYATPVKTKDWNWDVNINYSNIRNQVDELKEGVESIFLGGFVAPQIRAGIGNTYPVIYGSTFKRNANGQIQVESDDPTSSTYGLPEVGPLDVIGEVSPKFIIGMTNTVGYKNWSLSTVLEWKSGSKMYSGSNNLIDLYGVSERTEDRTSTFVYPGYKSDGSVNDIVRGGEGDETAYETLYVNQLNNIDESAVFDNSFIKLRELSVRYRYPEKVLDIAEIGGSLFLRNLLIWTKLDNFDPESSQGNNNMGGAFERFSMPQTTTLGFSVDLTF